ncbi:lysine-specific histone demethylase 1 homolog 3-like [Mangifera indica]|uniref:lysine-specific histone demethylase 1 homolog 3-like n=1 Tax=Mangifera indica TaxID=29780 RepID=UPI001CFAC86F|nr:lysine-specific histone demethylase 1 homolog 3-like [Mangifera indica]
MVGAHFSCDNDSKGTGSLGDSLEDRKEQELWPGEGSNLSLDEKMADSLSAPFQRTQSGLIRKSHMNSGLKKNGRDRNFDEGCSPSFDGDLKPVRRSQSVSTTKVRQKILNFNDNSHLVSDLSKLELTSQQCKKIEPMADTSGLNIQEEAILNTCTNNVCDISGNENVCVHGVDGSGFSQRASSGTQSLKVGLKLCSMDKASTLAPDDQEMPFCASSLEQMEEFYKCEGEYKRVFSDALRQHSRNASAIDNSSSDRKVSSSIGKEVSVACVDDELTDKSCKSKSLKVSKTGSDSNTALGEAGLAAISSKGEHDLVSNGRLSLTTEMSCGHRESGFAFQKRSSGFYPDQPSDASKGPCVPGHDPLSIGEEANRDSPSSVTLDENGSSPEDAVSIPDSENKDNKLSAVQRAARIAKKRRHGDMAYEGDADWENLINEQGFLENHQVVDCHRSLRGRDKFDSSSNILTVADNGGAATVSAGLKARAAGPIEKIKFKEVLKRRGGLQEYLECRNQILSLWSRDVSRILPLTECGVTDTPSEDEPSRASLIREIYTFLDQSGYINVGIASKKEKANHIAKHGYKLFKEEKLEGSSGASVADSEDGVGFILGQVKHSETSVEAKNGDISDDGNQMVKVKKGSLVSPELPNVTEHKVCPIVECLQNGSTDAPDILVNVNVLRADPSSKMVDGGKDPILIEVTNDSQSVKSGCHDVTWGSQHVQCDSEIRKKIIIIGAGPAGLTAARHLQRQGFSVILLEARNRIGGRVYTDHTSLSVPVDLGASIITGVEADVATERRPDPSSLICAQLGLELTVLNSDCPLYDIISGQKVPSGLDEALEAEYNSLLDDMVLLVAQKGEHAMKMSLEEGLEYALKRRRMARLGRDFEDIYLHNSMDAYSKASGVDSRVHGGNCFEEDALSPLERRVMNWHFANLEYGCAALLKEVSLPFWNQDDVYGGFGGAHCMIKGGYSAVVESLADELLIHFNHVVTDISYSSKDSKVSDGQSKVKVATANGSEFWGDAVLITVPLGCLKAESIKFFPPLPQWKSLAIQRLGFGVLNKVVLEFSEVFWDDSVDYFGATAEETDLRGWCFMFWNVRKTVGAPVLIALVVGKAAIDGQNMSSSDHVNHAVQALRKIFGEASVPDPVASVVTDWGRDPFSYGAYSCVAVGASGEDYDILGRPVENSLFFAGEATCKEHPDTVGGAMLSGLREAVRIVDIFTTGNDYTAEVEAMEAAQRQSESEGDEVMDIVRRLKAVEHSNVFYKNSFAQALIQTRESLLEDMFFKAKTTAGRLHLAKELLNLPVSVLKSFAGTKEGLTMLNSWILDSMGKDGTQLLRHCVRLLVLVSTDLHAVRLSGIGKTVKEKVCVHTSRDIRAIASQLVNVWLEVFRKGKNSSVGVKFSRQSNAVDPFKRKSLKDPASGKPPLHSNHSGLEHKGSAGSHLISGANMRRENDRLDTEVEDRNFAMSEEEQAAFAAAEAARAAAEAAARAAAEAAAKAFASSGPQLPNIPSFHKFARRDQYGQMDEFDLRRKWSGGVLGRQDCISEIDSRNCRVRDWSVDFSTACVNFDNSKTADNLSQRSHSNEIACQLNLREHSGESAAAADSSIFTKAWVDTAGSVGIKDYHAIERWQSQAAAADSDFFHPAMHVKDEEESNTSSKPRTWKHDRQANGSSVSQVTINNESLENRPRGADHIKQAVVDYVASLLMPLYKARKIDRDGYKTIMKKSATKVMEQATDAEKNMAVSEFLDSKRKNKIRSFVDKLIERHMTMKSTVIS